MLLLASAVSDFYVKDMAEHKIQSHGGEDTLSLHLHGTPKVLGHVTRRWSPEALAVSFKLETDADLLDGKAQMAIEKCVEAGGWI
jgi:phosphopantothenate-cysteine ligase